MIQPYKNFFIFAALLFLASCSRHKGPERLLPPESVIIRGDMGPQDSGAKKALPFWAQTKGDGVYKIGKPYKVNGVWYFPAENPNYDEIGFAAPYPKTFQGKRTANGEIYNEDALTGCHKTLPLPSVVRVTNLFNNKSVILRINDRGPFVNDRLIDISEKAATLLEFPKDETPKVRIEILSQESKEAVESLQKPVTTAASEASPLLAKQQPKLEENEEIVNSLEAPVETLDEAPSTESPPMTEEALFDPVISQQPAPAAQEVYPPAQEKSAFPPAPEESLAPVEQITPPGETFYVQAGVFGNPKNAEKLAEKLGSIGSVKSTEITIRGRSLNRVRVGPFTSIGDADRALEQVRDLNLPDARVVAQ
jgi:rare lipoprotein A